VLATNSTKKTQIIQTTKLDFTNLPNTFFKDEQGNCWNYLGVTNDTFSFDQNVSITTVSGNYFTNVVDIVYPSCDDCNLNSVSSCTFTYFSATKCDDSTSINVKVCNVGPVVGITKLLPTVGQICGIKNPSGDDFCVTLNSQISQTDTIYEIITPAWKDYTCETCPKYKKYKVDSCDGFITDHFIYDDYDAPQLQEFTIVSVNIDNICYIIKSYEGIEVEFNFDIYTTPKIVSTYETCNSCDPKQ